MNYSTELTLIVALHQCCCGRLIKVKVFLAVVLIIAAFWLIVALVVWSVIVASILIPELEGIKDVSVTTTLKLLLADTLALEASIVKTIDGSCAGLTSSQKIGSL